MACPAAPGHYQYNPVKTMKTSVLGAVDMLGLASMQHEDSAGLDERGVQQTPRFIPNRRATAAT